MSAMEATAAATAAATAITPSALASSATDCAAWICSWLAASKRRLRLSASLGVIALVDMKPTYAELWTALSINSPWPVHRHARSDWIRPGSDQNPVDLKTLGRQAHKPQ
jgi:hypothetical protein